jgi:hypothetical protein
VPSLWRVQKTTFLLLVIAVMGTVTLHDWLTADPHVHRSLANTRRKRKPHVCYPVRRLI